MTTLYAGLRDTAHRLISDKGKSVTIRTITTTTPVKSYRPVEANSDETGKAIVIEYTARDVDGSTVQTGDKRYLVAAKGLTVAPTSQARLIDGSDELEIVRVTRLSPAGTDLVYDCQCRETGK